MELPWTELQQKAIELVSDFITSPSPGKFRQGKRYFLLAGSAGTGKTSLLMEVQSKLSKQAQQTIRWTAPTNKAAKVLSSKIGKAMTIYKLLSISLNKNGEIKTLKKGDTDHLNGVRVIFVDEASMISGQLADFISQTAIRYDLKVIFLGDNAQLPPVGETESKVWQWEYPEGQRITLTEVVRHGGEILEFAKGVREQTDSFLPSISYKGLPKVESFEEYKEKQLFGVLHLPKKDIWIGTIAQAAYDGHFDSTLSPEASTKVISWRNVNVDNYNFVVRQVLYGERAKHEPFLVGDKIVATSPVIDGKTTEILMTTDSEGIILEVEEVPLPSRTIYMSYKLTIELDSRGADEEVEDSEGRPVIIAYAIHKSSKKQFDSDLTKLADSCKAKLALWKVYWENVELVSYFKHSYALTAHRSQGSSYRRVWVDATDILSNRNRKEAFQCLYVASTRAKEALIIT